VDALGNAIGFFLTGGEAHDLVGADHLLPEMEAETLIADKAFDADARVITPLAAVGKKAVIPPKANRKSPRRYDRHIYKERHLIENFFARLKQYRAIATRYDKTARNFLAAVYLAAAVDWLNCWCGRPPAASMCQNEVGLVISDKGDRPWTRLAELEWIRRSTFSNFTGLMPPKRRFCGRSYGART
jgi:transposase